MAFLETDKTVEDILLGTHVDYINLWASIHDEGDLYVPKILRDAIMKKVTSLVSLKDLLDKYNLPGLSMSYDVEFDDWNSWTASSGVDVYSYPNSSKEDLYRSLWEKSVSGENKEFISETPEGRTVFKPYHEADEAWLQRLSKFPDGLDKVIIRVEEGTDFEYSRKVTYLE